MWRGGEGDKQLLSFHRSIAEEHSAKFGMGVNAEKFDRGGGRKVGGDGQVGGGEETSH